MAEQKTEQATSHRLRKARQEGRFPVSRDFVVSAQLVMAFGVGLAMWPQLYATLESGTAACVHRAFSAHELRITELVAIARVGVVPPLEVLLEMG